MNAACTFINKVNQPDYRSLPFTCSDWNSLSHYLVRNDAQTPTGFLCTQNATGRVSRFPSAFGNSPRSSATHTSMCRGWTCLRCLIPLLHESLPPYSLLFFLWTSGSEEQNRPIKWNATSENVQRVGRGKFRNNICMNYGFLRNQEALSREKVK